MIHHDLIIHYSINMFVSYIYVKLLCYILAAGLFCTYMITKNRHTKTIPILEMLF